MTASNSRKHIELGNQYFESGDFKNALVEFREAVNQGSDQVFVYEKMIEAHKKSVDNWTESDFAESLTWTMKLQELRNPHFKRINARVTPEWKEISLLVKQLLQTKSSKDEDVLIEKILVYGESAVYPLLDFLLSFKSFGKNKST